MKSFAVLGAVAAVASAQNMSLSAIGTSLSTTTFTSCATGSPCTTGTILAVPTSASCPSGSTCTTTGTILDVLPCTATACQNNGVWTTAFKTIYTMYCPTAPGYTKAYTTTVTETCTGATPSFSTGAPNYVPSGWTSTVVTCTECGATPVSSKMTFPTSAPAGAVVPPAITSAPKVSSPAGVAPAAAGNGTSPGTGSGAGTGSSGSGAGAPAGAGSPAASGPAASSKASAAAAASSKASSAAAASAAASGCPGGASCPASGSSSPASGNSSAVLFKGEAGRSTGLSAAFAAAVLVAGAAILL